MIKRFLIMSFLFFLAGPKNIHADSYMITNACLLSECGDERVSILFENDMIKAFGTDIQHPENAVHIEAAGRIITPGFMNSATNLGLLEIYSVKETVDYNGAASKLESAFDVQFGLNANSILLGVARSEGLTRAVVLPSGAESVFAGHGALLHLVDGDGILEKPKAMLVVEAGGKSASDKSRSAVWVGLYKAFNEAKRAGEDDSAQVSALKPVVTGEKPLVITANRESDLRQAIRFAKKTNSRLVVLGGAEAWRVADELAAAGIAVVLNPYDVLPGTFDAVGSRAENAAILHDAGVLIAFSVSSIFKSHNAGIALRIGAGYAVSNGLEKQAALDAITINPAKIWGIDDTYGVLEVGKSADIILWSGDPLEPLSVADRVFISGKPLMVKSRQIQLRDKYHPHKR